MAFILSERTGRQLPHHARGIAHAADLRKPFRNHVGNLDTDKVDPYTMRAIFDPGAFKSVVPSEDYCVPGSVYELEEPVQMFGYKTNSSVEQCTHSGLIALKSNTGCRGYILIPALIDKLARRILINQAVLDDRGWYTEYGGCGVRMRQIN